MQAREDTDDFRIALRAQHSIIRVEILICTAGANIPVQHFRFQIDRNLAAGILQQRDQIIGGMAKGEAAFDAEAVNDALARMSEESARIEGLFETRADDPKSEARALIWEDFSGFTEKADDLTKVTAGLSGTIQSADDLGPLLKQVGKSCSTCHSDYRE